MKKFIFTILFTFCMLGSFCYATDSVINMDSLNIDVLLTEDGDMKVNETWSITSKSSETFFRSLKYENITSGDILDVKILASNDYQSGEKKEYAHEIIESGEMTKGSYYIYDDDGKLGILCRARNKYDNKFYVSYTIKDVVTIYDDCAEFNWDFLNNSKNIVSSSITGQICFPKNVSNVNEVLAWKNNGKLNSTITTIKADKITFEEKEFWGNGILQVRLLMPVSIFKNEIASVGHVAKDTILHEQNSLVQNSDSKIALKNFVITGGETIILIFLLVKLFYYIRESGKSIGFQLAKETTYYAQLPYDGITPGQASFIKNLKIKRVGDIFAAAMLNMKIKGVIDFEVPEGKKSDLGNTYIKILQENPTLTIEERSVFDFLMECSEKFKLKDKAISLKKLQAYIAASSEKVSQLKKDIAGTIKISVPTYRPKEAKRRQQRLAEALFYVIVWGIMVKIHGSEFDFFAVNSWIRIFCLAGTFLCLKIASNVNILDKKGFIHRAKLEAFERFLLDFDQFNKEDIPEIAVWQYYIIFAVGLGHGEKVLENIGKAYENVEESEFGDTYIACQNIVKCNFTKSFLIATSGK